MSLWQRMARECVHVTRELRDDGEGGSTCVWHYGGRFEAALSRTGTEAVEVAGREVARDAYDVATTEALEPGDLFKTVSDGRMLRATSGTAGGTAPACASFAMRTCEAVEWVAGDE